MKTAFVLSRENSVNFCHCKQPNASPFFISVHKSRVINWGLQEEKYDGVENWRTHKHIEEMEGKDGRPGKPNSYFI